MTNGANTGQNQTPSPPPAQPTQPAQPAQQQYAQPAQPAQPTADEQKHNDRLGLRILLGVGKVVVAIMYVYCVAAIIFIAFGFFLLLFGASPDASFSNWIYSAASGFMEPFAGMFSDTELSGAGGAFSVAALFAIAAYAVAAWLVHMLYEWIRHQMWKAQHPSPTS